MYQVKTVDLPPGQATSQRIKLIINNSVPETRSLISVAVCQGPNGIQRLIIVYE